MIAAQTGTVQAAYIAQTGATMPPSSLMSRWHSQYSSLRLASSFSPRAATKAVLKAALSQLVSFQPPIATAQAEEARVWPGMRHALTAWKPAVRGHVRSTLGNQPLGSTITLSRISVG